MKNSIPSNISNQLSPFQLNKISQIVQSKKSVISFETNFDNKYTITKFTITNGRKRYEMKKNGRQLGFGFGFNEKIKHLASDLALISIMQSGIKKIKL